MCTIITSIPLIYIHMYAVCFLTYVVGFDFEPVHGRFVFSPADGSKQYTSQYVEIPIIDDYVKEPAEMFHMVFYDAQKANSSHVDNISVLDDDEEGVCALVHVQQDNCFNTETCQDKL